MIFTFEKFQNFSRFTARTHVLKTGGLLKIDFTKEKFRCQQTWATDSPSETKNILEVVFNLKLKLLLCAQKNKIKSEHQTPIEYLLLVYSRWSIVVFVCGQNCEFQSNKNKKKHFVAVGRTIVFFLFSLSFSCLMLFVLNMNIPKFRYKNTIDRIDCLMGESQQKKRTACDSCIKSFPFSH